MLSFPISTELLASSKVGVTVKQVQKVEDKGCREAAAKLVNKWRAMLSAGEARDWPERACAPGELEARLVYGAAAFARPDHRRAPFVAAHP